MVITMFEYSKFARCGKSIRKFAPEGGLRRVIIRDKKGRPVGQKFESRVRVGKTAKDHKNGCPQRSYQRKRERDAWRAQTRAGVYTDPAMVPAFPK